MLYLRCDVSYRCRPEKIKNPRLERCMSSNRSLWHFHRFCASVCKFGDVCTLLVGTHRLNASTFPRTLQRTSVVHWVAKYSQPEKIRAANTFVTPTRRHCEDEVTSFVLEASIYASLEIFGNSHYYKKHRSMTIHLSDISCLPLRRCWQCSGPGKQMLYRNYLN